MTLSATGIRHAAFFPNQNMQTMRMQQTALCKQKNKTKPKHTQKLLVSCKLPAYILY